jgi:C-terminal processing protease CtpA/Prc
MLSIANFLNNNDRIEKNNYIFISFSAEELGLYGSKYWLENSSIDLNNIIAMINLDMIGRLDTISNQLEVFGTGTTASWNEMIDSSNKDFKIKKISSGIGASDHNSFYLKSIPALHIFTGTHEDYHKSTDTAEKINFKGINSIVSFVTLLLEEVESKTSLPFQKTKTSGESKRAKMKVTMGIMPSYVAHDKGLLIDGVLSQKPAEIAGLLEGDIIIEINSNPINDIYDYMEQLSLFDPGDKTTVKVLRGETTKLFTIKF